MEEKIPLVILITKKLFSHCFIILEWEGGRGDLSFIPREGGGRGGGAEIESSIPRGLD
jgi:hypothetical protein